MAGPDPDSRDDGLTPESPDQAGVGVPELPIEKIEPERMVENEVRARLEGDGFTDDQILRWVEAYFADHDEGDADGVVAWIRDRESHTPDQP
jgi:hypothetical protein